MIIRGYGYVPTEWVNGVNEGSSGSVIAVAAPGVGKQLVIKKYKLNTLEADRIEVLKGEDLIDTFLLGANGGYAEDFGNDPLILPANTALNIEKTSGNTLAWSVQYGVI